MQTDGGSRITMQDKASGMQFILCFHLPLQTYSVCFVPLWKCFSLVLLNDRWMWNNGTLIEQCTESNTRRIENELPVDSITAHHGHTISSWRAPANVYCNRLSHIRVYRRWRSKENLTWKSIVTEGIQNCIMRNAWWDIDWNLYCLRFLCALLDIYVLRMCRVRVCQDTEWETVNCLG